MSMYVKTGASVSDALLLLIKIWSNLIPFNASPDWLILGLGTHHNPILKILKGEKSGQSYVSGVLQIEFVVISNL